MKFMALPLVAGMLVVLAPPAQAERLDCSLFRGARSQFACYENLSRAPNPELEETAKPAAAKSTRPRARRTSANNITPAARRLP
jgi:hypothetical protein